jgi:hypothetical protein
MGSAQLVRTLWKEAQDTLRLLAPDAHGPV